jgi:cellulose synthase/poly-beta-1,6-N-acetylglucosamine synthase-like glycosyltransferase
MLFWLLTTAVFALLVIHPYTTYPLSLVLLRRVRGKQPVQTVAGVAAGRIDLVFCAYNEAPFIEKKLENCLAIAERYPNVRIHVFSDGSTDATNAIIERYADHVRFVAGQRSGKSTGMNTLLAGCDGELTLFTDANVLLDVAGIASLDQYFSDPAVGCVVGQLVYINAAESSTASVGSLYWKLEERIKELESNTGSVMGADGSIFAIRRDLFQKVPPFIIDDYFTSFSILCGGRRIVRAPELLAYERTAEKRGEEFRRKMRIACRSFNAHRTLWPRLRQLPPLDLYKYVSHKLVRWLTVLWLLLGLLSGLAFAHSIGYLLPMLLLVLLAGLALIFAAQWIQNRLAQAVLDILTAYVATGYGIWRSLRGDRFQTWEVAGTTR